MIKDFDAPTHWDVLMYEKRWVERVNPPPNSPAAVAKAAILAYLNERLAIIEDDNK